jgi:hypothetical protein
LPAYRAQPQAQRDRTAVLGESYIVAAYLDGDSERYQLPDAYSANRSYGYFPPPPADHDAVLYIGRDPAALGAYLADTRRVGDVGEDMHADGVLNRLRRAARFGRTGSSFHQRTKEFFDGPVLT